MDYTKLQIRHDTAANFERFNPILADAELIYVTDEKRMKIGNGKDSYTALPYLFNELGEYATIDWVKENYLTLTQINKVIEDKNYATNVKVNEVENSIPKNVSQLTNDKNYVTATALEEKGYQSGAQVNDTINSKDLATNTRVNEVESIAKSKATMAEVEAKGYQNAQEVNDIIDGKGLATNEKVIAIEKEVKTKTTIQEVEGKGYQTAQNVNDIIKEKNFATKDELPVVPSNVGDFTNNVNYQTDTDVENTLTQKDYANNTRVNEVENTANSKATIAEVEEKGYQNAEQVNAIVDGKNYLTDEGASTAGYVKGAGLKTINNESIVGEGNLEIKGGGGANIKVDEFLNTGSGTPVENSIITYDIYKMKRDLYEEDEEFVFTLEDGTILKKNILLKHEKSFYIENTYAKNEILLNKYDTYTQDINLEYSKDFGTTWTSWADPYNTPIILEPYKKVFLRGTNNTLNGTSFSTTRYFNVGGNITSLLDPNFLTSVWNRYGTFKKLFENTKIEDARNLILPNDAYSSTYEEMFASSKLKYPPQFEFAVNGSYLSAQSNSCARMFSNANYLNYAPKLIFHSCEDYAFQGMFSGCRNFSEVLIEITYNENVNYCFDYMFGDASGLSKIEIKNLTKWKKENAQGWVQGVNETGTFIKPKELIVGDGEGQIPIASAENNYSGIPAGWTIIDK